MRVPAIIAELALFEIYEIRTHPPPEVIVHSPLGLGVREVARISARAGFPRDDVLAYPGLVRFRRRGGSGEGP